MVEVVAAGKASASSLLPRSDRTSLVSVLRLPLASSPVLESSSALPLLLSHLRIPRLELDSLTSPACATIHEPCGFLRSLRLSGLSSLSNDLGLTMPPVQAHTTVLQAWGRAAACSRYCEPR